MFILYEIPLILIYGFLLGATGLVYSLLCNILYIIFALGLVGFFLLGLWKAIYQWFYISERGYVWCLLFSIINFFSYAFFPYYFYSSTLINTNSLEKGMTYSLLFASILFLILHYMEVQFYGSKHKNIICCTIIFVLLGIVTLVGCTSYPTLKNKFLEESNGIIEDQHYQLTENYCLRFDSESYPNSNKTKYDSARFPFWTGNSFYPFKYFQKDETVYLLDHPEKYDDIYCHGLFPTGEENLEECFLVVNKNMTKVGYVPKQFLKPIMEN